MQVGFKCVKGRVPFEECCACAEDPLHPCDYPTPVLQIMQVRARESRERAAYSATSLNQCDRRDALKAGADWYGDIDQEYATLRGEMMHALLQQEVGKLPQDTVLYRIKEERFETTVETSYGPQQFTGKPDLVEIVGVNEYTGKAYVRVYDWKTKKEIGHDFVEPSADHIRQVNYYGYLLSKALPDFLQRTFGFTGPREVTPENAALLLTVTSVEIVSYELFYIEMKRARRFTSEGPLQAKGKEIRGRYLDAEGCPIESMNWDRWGDKVHEVLDLVPIPVYPMEKVKARIVSRIEDKIRAQHQLPPPLTGEDAWVCDYCPVREECFRRAGVPL